MELNQLLYFKAVAETGSVTRAAESLHITQPALSRSISKLEQEVGAPLFSRESHGLRLNEYGKIFLKSADKALSQLSSGVDSVRRLYRQENSILSISCSSEDFLADMLIGFTAQHPEIGIRQYRHSTADIEKNVLGRLVELAVSIQPIDSRELNVENLSSAECVLICRDSRRLPETVSLRDIAELDFICDESRISGQTLREIFARYDLEPRITHQVEHTLLLHELLSADAGVALIPLPSFYQMRERHGDSGLTVHHIKEPVPRAEIQAAWLRDKKLSTGAELFIEYVREKMAEEKEQIDKWLSE